MTVGSIPFPGRRARWNLGASGWAAEWVRHRRSGYFVRLTLMPCAMVPDANEHRALQLGREYDRPIITQVQCLWNRAKPYICCSNGRPSLQFTVTAVPISTAGNTAATFDEAPQSQQRRRTRPPLRAIRTAQSLATTLPFRKRAFRYRSNRRRVTSGAASSHSQTTTTVQPSPSSLRCARRSRRRLPSSLGRQ